MNLFHVLASALIGVTFIVVVRSLSRRGRLSMRYTLGWLLIGLLSLLYPGLLIVARNLADLLEVQPVAILLGMPLVILGLVCVQLSISVSGLTEQVRTLTEIVAVMNSKASEVDDSDDDPATRESSPS